jgi:hypothetical protein
MELTFQLLNTLESLENKSMHKFADRLANTMIKLAFYSQGGPAASTSAPIAAPPTATELLSASQQYKINFDKATKNMNLEQKINLLDEEFAKHPENSKYSKFIFDDLLDDDFFKQPLDDQLKFLDAFAETKDKTLAKELTLKSSLDKIFKNPDFDVLKLGKFKNLESLPEFKNLAQAAESLGFIKPDQIEDLSKAIKPGTKGQAVIKSLKDQAATRALGEVAKKIPAVKGILPLLGTFIGAVGLIPALIGIISDVNKYGIDKIWDDAELKMKFGENLTLLVADIAAMFPFMSLIFGPISAGLQYAFDKKREEILKDQAKQMDKMLEKARPHVRRLVSENPKITLDQIRQSVDKYYNWATANSLKNKERYEIFLNEEVPQIIKEIKSKEYNPYAEPMQQMTPGTMITINTEKPKVTAMPNNKASRTVIANTLKAARELENDGYYMEADLSTFIALELTKMTR